MPAADGQVAERADEDADDSEEPSLYDLPPPWAPHDGAWDALQAHLKPLKRLFAAAAAPLAPSQAEGAPELEEEAAVEAAVLTGIAYAADVERELGRLSELYTALPRAPSELFEQAQPQYDAFVSARPVEMHADWDDFLTFAWLVLRAKFGPVADGFGAKVKAYLDACPELVPPPPPAEPEPDAGEASPKKKKK